MNKFKTLVLAVAAAVAFNSCTQQNAQKYNETVVGLYAGYVNNFGNDVNKITAEGTTKENADAALKHMSTNTDSCLGVLNGLKPSDEAKDFHNKVVAVLNTVKTEAIPELQKLASLKGTENVDEYNKVIDSYNATSDKISKLEDEAGKAQESFAQKVGMKMEK